MAQNQDTKNHQQQDSNHVNSFISKLKRNYDTHAQTIYDKEEQIESFTHSQTISMKKKHQNVINKLMSSSLSQNCNKHMVSSISQNCNRFSQKQNQIKTEKQNQIKTEKQQQTKREKQQQNFQNKDHLASSTQQDSYQVSPTVIYYKNNNESSFTNDQKQDTHKVDYQKHLIQDVQNVHNTLKEDKNQLIQSQSHQESSDQQKSQSLLFIPFQKTQQQILALKKKQLQLIKAYTPLHQSQVLPWFNEEIKSIEDPIIRFHQEIKSFYFYIKPSKQQHQKRMAIFAQIKTVIISIYPQAKVFPFGSFATGLYLPDGDIDVVALIQYETANRQKNKEFYKEIYRQFKKNHRSKYTQITFISSAKIPLVKMIHRETGFSIDISLNTLTGLQQIQEVRKMTKRFSQFKFIIFVLKVMLRIRYLSETFSGGIGSYLLFCMVFHYLRDFQENTRPEQYRFYGLGDMILNFFSFYFMNVDFFKQSIDIKSGRITQRPRRKNTLSILSPLDQKVDIGKKAWRMRDILLLFKNRHKIIVERHFQQQESILKQLINPAMTEFEYYDLKKDKAYIQEQEDYMENFSKNLVQEIQNTIKKDTPCSQQKTLRHRRYYKVNRQKTLGQGQKNDVQKGQYNQEVDSTSY